MKTRIFYHRKDHVRGGRPVTVEAWVRAVGTGAYPGRVAARGAEATQAGDGDAATVPTAPGLSPETEAPEPASRHSLTTDASTLIGVAWRLNRRRFILQIIFLLSNGIVGGVSLLLLIPIVNSIANPDSKMSVPLFGDVQLSSVPLVALLAAFVGLTAVSALITRTSAVNSTALQQTIVDDLRQEAFEAILAAKWTFVLQRRKSDIIEVVTSGAARSGMAFYQLLQLSVTAVLFVVTAIVALVVSPLVAGIAIVGVVLVGVAQGSAVRPAHRMGREFGLRNRSLQAVMMDSMDSLRLVRAHGADAIWAERLGEAFTGTRAVQIANTRRTSTVSAVSSVGLALAASALVLVSVWAEVSPAAIVVILLLVARLARGAQSMAGTSAMLANALPAVRDLTALTQQARDDAEVPPGTVSTRGPLGSDEDVPLLEFRDVTFVYPNSTNGIHEVNFTARRGDITVLTGHSGSGKSTTADLSLGLLMPQSGAILVDGEPITPADLAWWREHVAYVPQETVLVPGTLRENLVWSASPEPDDDACWLALDRAAADFARTLPGGLDTVLGDRGVRLSGGERQRVAIARALLRNPTLLVMDEATSALDDATEARVLGLMTSLVPAITVLVIAHRQSTVDAGHHVVRFEAGRAA